MGIRTNPDYLVASEESVCAVDIVENAENTVALVELQVVEVMSLR